MKSITKFAPLGRNINLTNLSDPSKAWASTNNLNASDGGYASNDFGDGIPSQYYPLTKWLHAYDFQFFTAGDQNVLTDFPSNGTVSGPIVGISVQVVKHCTLGPSHCIGDYELGLVTKQTGGQQLFGSSSPTMYLYPKIGDQLSWPVVIDQTFTYGSNSDLWGRNWTPAELNDMYFGFVLCAEYETSPTAGPDFGGSSSQGTAFVDSVSITVYYVATITVPSTGGITLGGSAVVSDRINVTATGGSLANGEYTNTFSERGAGGATEDGSATILLTHIPASTGGITLGSSASIQETVNVAATGGVVLNGTYFNVFSDSSTGGVVLDSTSPLTIDYNQTTAGGIVCGTAAIAGITPYISGGVEIGGITTTQVIIVAHGGCVLDNSGNVSVSYNIATTNGLVIGAVSQILATYNVSTLGGVEIGGKFIVAITEPSTGGMVLGGKFIVGISSPSTGGVVLGSRAIVALWIFGHGGVVLNGTTFVQAVYNIRPRAGIKIGGRTASDYLKFYQKYTTGVCRTLIPDSICVPVVVPPLTRFIKDQAPPLDPRRFVLKAGSPWCDTSIKTCGTIPFLPKLIVSRQKGHVPPSIAS